MTYMRNLKEIGGGTVNRAVTATLYVCPNGSGTDGLTWDTAYTTIQAALTAASTDPDDSTLILVSPHDTQYDINTTGDPTFTGNYVIKGTHRTWSKIKNTHASATSILKFTGRCSFDNLNFNLGTGSTNGIISTDGAFRMCHCQFVATELTGAATALHIDGAAVLKHGIIEDCHFLGNVTHAKALLLDNTSLSLIKDCQFHKFLTAIQIVNANSDENTFTNLDIGCCGIGIDIDAGNEQHIDNILFHGNTTNIDDEVGDHFYAKLRDSFDLSLEPDDFTGVNVPTGDGANLWGADTEIRAAATSTKPFRVVAIISESDASEMFRLRFSHDSGSTHYDDILVQGTAAVPQRSVGAAPSGTEHIFNKGTRISCSSKSESAGIDNSKVWLSVQII